MEGNGWLLEDQRNALAADCLKQAGLGIEKILALKQNSAVDNNGAATEQPQQRYRKRTFARSGLSKDAQNLSPLQMKTNSVDRS